MINNLSYLVISKERVFEFGVIRGSKKPPKTKTRKGEGAVSPSPWTKKSPFLCIHTFGITNHAPIDKAQRSPNTRTKRDQFF